MVTLYIQIPFSVSILVKISPLFPLHGFSCSCMQTNTLPCHTCIVIRQWQYLYCSCNLIIKTWVSEWVGGWVNEWTNRQNKKFSWMNEGEKEKKDEWMNEKSDERIKMSENEDSKIGWNALHLKLVVKEYKNLWQRGGMEWASKQTWKKYTFILVSLLATRSVMQYFYVVIVFLESLEPWYFQSVMCVCVRSRWGWWRTTGW